MNEISYLPEGNQLQTGYPHPSESKEIEAENMILGAIFLEPGCVFEVILEPYHFSQKRNQLIFQAMIELRQESQGIDIVTVVNKLGSLIESIGGVSYLSSLALSCPTTVHLEEYEQIMLEHYKLRELKRAAARFLNDGRLVEAEQFYQTFIKLQEIGNTVEETKQDLMMEIFNEMYEDQGDLSGIDTGFDSLNRMTSGWSKGDLIILAGRPSMGKTAFALSLAMNGCQKGGVVDLFSLEMPKKQLAKRILSSLSRIDGAKWKNPYRLFTEEDQVRANEALSIFHQWHLQIHDPPQKTVSGIRAQIQKTRREYPHEDYLVVIDYLQLIATSGKYDRHDLAIASITKELKQLARQYDVPIILLSQLSRGVEQRMDKRPKMSDLRDSGSIEQDADLIMLLYRDEYYNKNNSENKFIEIDLAKHRNGPVGMVKLLFEKEYGGVVDGGKRKCAQGKN
ncbi:replicative DNA helicase [Cytobacillus eiseniae]|uniref:Replicative DNA helicase n=1 Tax=Cytobacillus eiseniae TaxID=762947 RepID=A0ABS4RM66_9BACI|nr:replicative DNA helicase [Cytobacillus eiseniae]MBP2242912.1 replicative DNA helicase [Cytobacillus eiseniae]